MVAAGLLAAATALALAFFLRALIASTPARVSHTSLFWGTVLMGVSGLIAGMGVEAVRQLQRSSPEPEYRRGSLRGRRR